MKTAKYPDFAVTIPHADMRKKLRKILETAVSQSVVAVYDPRQGPLNLSVKNLWVVGSVAHGAEHCGDLDVVYELDGCSWAQATCHFRKLIKAAPRLSRYCGTPWENTSHVVFEGAIQVIKDRKIDEAEFDRVQVRPDYKRVERNYDWTPFQFEQFADHHAVDSLAQLRTAVDAGQVTATYIPYSELNQLPTIYYEQEWFDRQNKSIAKWQRQLVNFVGNRLDSTTILFSNFHSSRDRFLDLLGYQFVVGGGGRIFEAAHIGSPRVRAVVMLPELSSRGPNGFWVLEKGPAADVLALLGDKPLWVQVWGDDIVYGDICGSNTLAGGASLQLYTSESKVRTASWKSVKALHGLDLINAISLADRVALDGVNYHLNGCHRLIVGSGRTAVKLLEPIFSATR